MLNELIKILEKGLISTVNRVNGNNFVRLMHTFAPDHRTIVRSAILPTIFRHRICDHGLRRMCLQLIRASYDFLLWRRRSESEPYGDPREIVGYLHSSSGNRTEPMRCP